MKIEDSISQLLYRYQCVTVPGFGAFLTEFQSAQLHENSNTFYPPKKLISFNPYLKNYDLNDLEENNDKENLNVKTTKNEKNKIKFVEKTQSNKNIIQNNQLSPENIQDKKLNKRSKSSYKVDLSNVNSALNDKYNVISKNSVEIVQKLRNNCPILQKSASRDKKNL